MIRHQSFGEGELLGPNQGEDRAGAATETRAKRAGDSHQGEDPRHRPPQAQRLGEAARGATLEGMSPGMEVGQIWKEGFQV